MLKLTKKADYGLMALKFLAEHPETQALSAKDVADAYGIPALAGGVFAGVLWFRTPWSGAGLTERVIQLIALLTVLSLAPAILIMMTSFTRIIIVLSLLRQAMGTTQLPPNQVIIGLSLFMTFLV